MKQAIGRQPQASLSKSGSRRNGGVRHPVGRTRRCDSNGVDGFQWSFETDLLVTIERANSNARPLRCLRSHAKPRRIAVIRFRARAARPNPAQSVGQATAVPTRSADKAS